MSAVSRCFFCEEAIEPDGKRYEVAYYNMADGSTRARVAHEECHVRAVVGSVGHQCGLCGCFGGKLDDPPHMSKRQAARAAFMVFQAGFLTPRQKAALLRSWAEK